MELDAFLPNQEESWINRKHLLIQEIQPGANTGIIEFSLQEIGMNQANSSEVINLNQENEDMIRRLTLFFVPIAFAIILITGLIGNILVIVVVSKQEPKSTYRYFPHTLHLRNSSNGRTLVGFKWKQSFN